MKANPSNKLKFSIIVPTYNEERDIFRTLNALEGLDWSDYEVIIIDDGSKDKTVEIVKTFTERLPNYRLLIQPKNRGVSSARNRGVMEVVGEILVILNADVVLTPDFLKRIVPFYKKGKQWVAVRGLVLNQENLYPRYIEAINYYSYFVKKEHWVWSEGFSCTKKSAIEVGLFPEAMPGCSGEDVDFGLELERRFPGVKSEDIIAPHIAPESFEDFWSQQKGRGKGRTNYYYFIKKYSILSLIFNTFLSTGWRIFKMIYPLPVFKAWDYSSCSKGKGADFLGFIWAAYIQECAMIVGMWQALGRIISNKSIRVF